MKSKRRMPSKRVNENAKRLGREPMTPLASRIWDIIDAKQCAGATDAEIERACNQAINDQKERDARKAN